MHEVRHHAENSQRVRIGINYGIGGINGQEYLPFGRKQKALYPELTVKLGNNDVAMFRFWRAIYYQQGAVLQTDVLHAVALRVQEKVLARAIQYCFKSNSCSA